MCYHMETFHYDDPLFREVDATYIIHLESDTKRYEHIRKQLELYHPTKTVHIVFNKGFKTGLKPHVHDSVADLVDVCTYVMKDAQQYKTILLLEDDFMFNPLIGEHTKNVDAFVATHTHFAYRLGCVPFVQVPYDKNTWVGLSTGTHAVVLSRSVRHHLMDHPSMDRDIYLNFMTPNFIYYTPLCYQLFPQTENQKKWGNDHVVVAYMAKVLILLFQFLQLDKQVDPGYSIMYAVSKLVPLLVVVVIWRVSR
jgi:hypothetical protein